jgi:enoyl-CoA hydratase/carnithine racemase
MAKLNVEREGHIVVITINRPEVHNSLDPETLVRLSETRDVVLPLLKPSERRFE